MPTIAYFYGIAIRMYLREHPPPHFHAIYAEHDATVDIRTGEIVDGWLPKTAARLVKEWTLAQREGLLDNWRRFERGEPLRRLPGLGED
jgi:hypothetical protein